MRLSEISSKGSVCQLCYHSDVVGYLQMVSHQSCFALIFRFTVVKVWVLSQLNSVLKCHTRWMNSKLLHDVAHWSKLTLLLHLHGYV